MGNKVANRIKVNIATTGTGTVTFGSAVSNSFCSVSEADPALNDGDTVPYILADGLDFEMGVGTIGGTHTTMTRSVRVSKISGVKGTSPLNLSGSAVLSIAPGAEDYLFVDSTIDCGTF